MEVHIDTEQIVQAALVSAIAQVNPDELAQAMSKTLLEGPPRFSPHKTMLQELMHNAISEVAKKVIDGILRDQEDIVIAEVKRQLGGEITFIAADMIVKRVKDSKVQ